MADRFEMARNAIESDFRTSKMAAEKKKVLYRSEMARNAIKIVIFGYWAARINYGIDLISSTTIITTLSLGYRHYNNVYKQGFWKK